MPVFLWHLLPACVYFPFESLNDYDFPSFSHMVISEKDI